MKESAMNRSMSDMVKPAATRVSTAASGGWDSTVSVFAPLAGAMKQGSARATKLDAMKRNKKDNGGPKIVAVSSTTTEEQTGHSGLYALLATGVAVGAAGALVARRRTRAKWAEYEPSSIRSDASSFMDAGATSAKSYGGTEGGTDSSVTKAATWTKDRAKTTVGTIKHKIHEATAEHGDTTIEDKMESVTDKAAEKVNEGASHIADKAEAKHNAGTRTGGSSTNTSGAAARTDKIDDEVDDLIRSAKNGRM
jgi:hypothetical protein